MRRFLNQHVPAHIFERASQGQPDAEETIVRAMLDALAAWERAEALDELTRVSEEAGLYDREVER